MTGTMDPSANFNLIITQTELERFKFLIRSFLRARIGKVCFVSPSSSPSFSCPRYLCSLTLYPTLFPHPIPLPFNLYIADSQTQKTARQIPPPPPLLPKPLAHRIPIRDSSLHTPLPPLLHLLLVFFSPSTPKTR
jgi:hypothetical protein